MENRKRTLQNTDTIESIISTKHKDKVQCNGEIENNGNLSTIKSLSTQLRIPLTILKLKWTLTRFILKHGNGKNLKCH